MYETPELPEHINAPERHPLLDFLRVALTAGLIIGGLCVAVWWSASWLARQTPFAWEQRLVGEQVLGPFEIDAADPRSAALQALADRLCAAMALPPDMQIRVHYSDAEIANAFATLGGHVVITRGLLESVHSENGLAMVLAHEIGHVRHRDPAGSLGGALALSLLVGFVTGGEADLSAIGAQLTQLSFSRAQEREADAVALAALQAIYGHQHGADEFFAHVLEHEALSGSGLIPSFLSTHPHVDERLATIRQAQSAQPGSPLQPLPAALGDPAAPAERQP